MLFLQITFSNRMYCFSISCVCTVALQQVTQDIVKELLNQKI
jgi:hypothetical protein